jgi:hypothetical protein
VHLSFDPRRPGELWSPSRFRREIADPDGNDVPPVRLGLALPAAAKVLAGLAA